MKERFVVTAVLIAASVLSGCASVGQQPAAVCQGPWAGGPLTEMTAGETPPPGMAVVTMKATVKTHSEGYYLLEPEHHAHGKAGFRFAVTVDIKAFNWKDDGREELLPQYDAAGALDPEAGQGVRYTIEKSVVVAPGKHRVLLELPSEGRKISVEFDVAADARPYVLEFKPVYNGPHTRRFGFRYGVVAIKAFLNGAPLPECRS